LLSLGGWGAAKKLLCKRMPGCDIDRSHLVDVCSVTCSVSLSSEVNSIHELAFTTGGSSDQFAAHPAVDGGLGVRKDAGDMSGCRFHVHEEGVGVLNESLQFVLGLLKVEIGV
jgi:hypothetical protein